MGCFRRRRATANGPKVLARREVSGLKVALPMIRYARTIVPTGGSGLDTLPAGDAWGLPIADVSMLAQACLNR
jgi:hypothetical protein